MGYKKQIFFFIFFTCALALCYYFSEQAYKQQKVIDSYTLEKPSLLPSPAQALQTSFGFRFVKADYYRLRLIQYIGGNIFNYSYKDYLYEMTQIITELSPSFEDSYVVAELLLPAYNPRYEERSEEEREKFIDQAVAIGEKAVSHFCDEKKLQLIKAEENLEALFREKVYKNPCRNYEAIYNLAYIYFYYKNDPKTASYYYKVTSVIDGAPEGAKNMIAIMNGKGGEREKAFFMQLHMARYGAEDEACVVFANELAQVGETIFSQNDLPSQLLQEIETLRAENFMHSEGGFAELACGNYINKAVRELNLFYIDQANSLYKKEKGENAKSAKVLYDEGFMDYLPRDFQRDETSEVIYFFDEKYGFFNYKMGNYEYLE